MFFEIKIMRIREFLEFLKFVIVIILVWFLKFIGVYLGIDFFWRLIFGFI